MKYVRKRDKQNLTAVEQLSEFVIRFYFCQINFSMKENLIGSRNRDELIMRFVVYFCQTNDYGISIWEFSSYGHSVGLNFFQNKKKPSDY